jgi:hypothetical protein
MLTFGFDQGQAVSKSRSLGQARYVPVPESSITCGLDEALSLMVTMPQSLTWFALGNARQLQRAQRMGHQPVHDGF